MISRSVVCPVSKNDKYDARCVCASASALKLAVEIRSTYCCTCPVIFLTSIFVEYNIILEYERNGNKMMIVNEINPSKNISFLLL